MFDFAQKWIPFGMGENLIGKIVFTRQCAYFEKRKNFKEFL